MVVPSRSSLQDTVPRQEPVQQPQQQQHPHLLLLRPHHHHHHQHQHSNNISIGSNSNLTTKPYRDGKTKLIPPPHQNNNRRRCNQHSQHDPFDQLDQFEQHGPFDQAGQPDPLDPLNPFDLPNQHHQHDCDPHRRRPSRSQRSSFPLLSKTATDTRESWKTKWESNHDRPTSKRPLRSRGFPDPLNTISCPDRSAPARSAASVFIHPAPSAPLPVRRTTRQSHHLPVAIDADAQQHAAGGPVVVSPGSPERLPVGETDTISWPSLPNGAPLIPERRLLRSHDGCSRSKSELAMYFPNYEQMISLEPPKSEFLTGETPVILLDDLTESPLPSSPTTSPLPVRKLLRSPNPTINSSPSPFGNPCLRLHGCEVISPPELEFPTETDPLDDAIYTKAHRRIERQEKQLRNIERERAQHEKVQLERLLDELQGHDWLRVMGVSGITETEKKLYEPKRALFVREVTALIEKFRVWKEEEKRRKTEKELVLLDNDADVQMDAETDLELAEEDPHSPLAGLSPQPMVKKGEADGDVHPTSTDLPNTRDPSGVIDVDAWAARQLHQEARSSVTRTRKSDESSRLPFPAALCSPPPPPQPFTSFYSKRYLRDAAICHYRRGRTRTAFGVPIPEMEEREFQLPPDILTPDAINSCMRKRRRLKRERRS